MAVFRANTKDLPPGAKVLDKDGAYTHLFTEIQKHQPAKDVYVQLRC